MARLADMTGMTTELNQQKPHERRSVLRRSFIIALIAFLTVIDLFGSQALLPTLVKTFGVSPGVMGFAVNASTIGMALASLIVAILAPKIDRRRGIWICLALLSIPTFLLAQTGDLVVFTALRVLQGMFMAAAFTLTLTYLSEQCSITAIGGAMAAYITGNVASNLFGRLLASGLADNLGLAQSFYAFALLNLTGAAVAFVFIGAKDPERDIVRTKHSVTDIWRDHLTNPVLLATISVGFILLFIFVATFTYANLILSAAPFSLPQAYVGAVYLIFVPAILTTPLAALAVRRFGAGWSFNVSVGATTVGLLLLLLPSLALFLVGLAMVGAGLFFAQSVVTGLVGRTVSHDQASANGLYLASYYLGGLAGAFVIGQVFELIGWTAVVITLSGLSVLLLALSPKMTSR